MRLRPIVALALYSISCVSMHSLLAHYYYQQCSKNFFSMFWDESMWCSFLSSAKRALQTSPLLFAAPLLMKFQDIHQHFDS